MELKIMKWNIYISGALMFGLLVLVGLASADTYIVDDNWAGADYSSIQDAVDAAADTDEILVHYGTYYENVVIDKQLSIVGNGTAGTYVIDETGVDVIDVNHDNCNISGLTVQGGGTGSGSCIDITGYNLNNIWYCVLTNASGSGIFLSNSDLTTVAYCEMFENDLDGIEVYGDQNEVMYCDMYSNGDDGIHFLTGTFNIVHNSSSYYNTDDGVLIGGSGSENNSVIDCDIYGNGQYGIFVTVSHHDRIVDNWIYQNAETGIEIEDSNNTWINYTSISYHGIAGVAFHAGSEFNYIHNCSIFNNTGYGIDVYEADYNSIYFNEIFNNSNYGVNMVSGCNNNLVHHNNFINNTGSSSQGRDTTGNNDWDDGEEGNYWNDYSGTDVNHDGIGDQPYNIAGGLSNDTKPLMDDVNTSAPEKVPEFASIILPIIGTLLIIALFWRRE